MTTKKKSPQMQSQPPAQTVEAPIKEAVINVPVTEPQQLLPLPYPGFDTFNRGKNDRRHTMKVNSNALTQLLNEEPNHPQRKEIEDQIKGYRKVADMSDKEFHSHELYEANPIHKLTQDEKLHCIRTLPMPLVKKLFTHII